MTYRHLRQRVSACARRTVLFALLAAIGFDTDPLCAEQQQTPAPQAPAAKPQPFDPHDISGIWKNPGGFDPIIGNESSSHDGMGKGEVE